ncbi:hypothetical protein KD050_14075 [Psychrobacillus sp. INOP01]|nr:hypothetical protein KD050_14075 [Psychrobacillus sp. INOP01]
MSSITQKNILRRIKMEYSTNGCFTSRRSKAFFLIELTKQVLVNGCLCRHYMGSIQVTIQEMRNIR